MCWRSLLIGVLLVCGCSSTPVLTVQIPRGARGSFSIHFNPPGQGSPLTKVIVSVDDRDSQQNGYVPSGAKVRFVSESIDVTTACIQGYRLSNERTGDKLLVGQVVTFTINCR